MHTDQSRRWLESQASGQQGGVGARPGAMGAVTGPPIVGPRAPGPASPWPRPQRPLPLAWPGSHLAAPWPGPSATWTGLFAFRSKVEDS